MVRAARLSPENLKNGWGYHYLMNDTGGNPGGICHRASQSNKSSKLA